MLELTRESYDDIVYESYRGGDEEVCGVLAGEYGGEESRATAVFPAENVAETPQVRYYMDPEEQLDITERIEDRGLDVVGFYHSHPAGPPEPSDTDAERATWPGYSYVICALDGYPCLGSWRWTGDGFEREAVAVVDGG